MIMIMIMMIITPPTGARRGGDDGQDVRPIPLLTLDFRGFDSSVVLNLRGGILRPIGDFPESLSPAMLVGVMLVGGLGVRSKGK